MCKMTRYFYIQFRKVTSVLSITAVCVAPCPTFPPKMVMSERVVFMGPMRFAPFLSRGITVMVSIIGLNVIVVQFRVRVNCGEGELVTV